MNFSCFIAAIVSVAQATTTNTPETREEINLFDWFLMERYRGSDVYTETTTAVPQTVNCGYGCII